MVTPFEPGRIVMVAFPFTDNTSTKYRPALVVSSKAFNTGEDFIAVPISSRDDPHGYPILKSEPYFGATQLRADSTIKWRKPMTISSRIVTRQLGTIPDEVLKAVQERIRSVLS
jgi:mRNA interferase MazF